jgi:hypothetical protein
MLHSRELLCLIILEQSRKLLKDAKEQRSPNPLTLQLELSGDEIRDDN